MLRKLQLSPNHLRSPGDLYPNVITKGNIGTNNPLTTFGISGMQCRVDDISGNEVGIITILISFEKQERRIQYRPSCDRPPLYQSVLYIANGGGLLTGLQYQWSNLMPKIPAYQYSVH